MANEKDWQQDISTTVDTHTTTIADHEERITANKVKLNEHETRIDNIETTTDVGQITLRVNAIEQKNTEQDSRLDNIDTKNNAQDETLATYSERLDNIDSLDVEQNSKIKAIQDKDTEQDTKIADLEKKSKIHDESINTINSINSEQNARLTSLETKDSEQDKKVQDLSNALTTKGNELKEKIDTNATNILANSGEISAIKEKLIDSTLTEKGLVQLTNAIDASEDKATTPKAVLDYTTEQFTLKGNATYDDIGKAGQLGFGQSACSDFAHVKECEFTPLQGTADVNSDNYGVYLHKYGGLCCYIPKFWVRIGSENAPQYEKYKLNSIEIAKGDAFDTEEQAFSQGWFLPRAFIDGGKIKNGFFVQMTFARTNSQSTKDGVNYPTSNLTNSGIASIEFYKMIDRAKTLGQGWNVCSAFMYGAMQILTLAHAQMSDWYTSCGWYLSSRDYQYPQKNTNATNPQFTSHNGQKNGVQSFWHYWEFVTGITTAGTTATQGQIQVADSSIYILKKEKSFADLSSGFGGKTDAWGTDTSLLSMYDKYTCPLSLTKRAEVRWGNAEFPCLSTGIGETSIDEIGRALCGVFPKNDNAISSGGINMMNTSLIALSTVAQNLGLLCGGYAEDSGNGVFARSWTGWRTRSNDYISFRCARY